MIFKKIFFFYIICLFGCGIYSFTGSSIPKEAKSIYIEKIENNASLTNPEFSQILTNSLINRFLNETNLSIEEDLTSDLIFKGQVLDYYISPVSINSNESASQNRLTITVKIIYVNNVIESEGFEKKFTNYTDFDSNLDFLQIEEELNNLIIEDLIESIFNEAFSNW